MGRYGDMVFVYSPFTLLCQGGGDGFVYSESLVSVGNNHTPLIFDGFFFWYKELQTTRLVLLFYLKVVSKDELLFLEIICGVGGITPQVLPLLNF